MKTSILILFTTVMALIDSPVQETTITAAYEGVVEGIYYFGNDTESFGFDGIAQDAADNYDLDREEFVGQTFEVTYETIVETDDDGMEVELSTITDILLVE